MAILNNKMLIHSIFTLTIIILISALPASSENNPNDPRPHFSANHGGSKRPDLIPESDVVNFREVGCSVMGCTCWASANGHQEIRFVNCTKAHKETVPQVHFFILFVTLN